MWIAALALIGAFVATYLTLYKLGVLGTITCSVGSCETVQASRWATFLGLPVAAWGLGYYVVVLGIALFGLQEPLLESRLISGILVGLTGWGFIFSGYLTALEAFAINAWCQWCVVSAVIATIIFIVAVLDALELRRLSMLEPSGDGGASSGRAGARGG